MSSRYRDEPFKTVFSSKFGWAYLLLNGLLSLAALWVLRNLPEFVPAPGKKADPLLFANLAITAGFGSAVIIRARLFSARIGDQDVAVGPGYVVDQLLSILDRQIDRKRALERTGIVTSSVTGVDFERSSKMVSTLILGSTQNLSPQEQKRLANRIREIRSQPTANQEKSFALGFLVLDFMGEDFLAKVMEKAKELKLTVDPRLAGELEMPAARLVQSALEGVPFERVAAEIDAMAAATHPSLEDEEMDELRDRAQTIRSGGQTDQEKCYALGDVLLEFFTRDLFLSYFPLPES